MARLFDIAKFLAASWTLSEDGERPHDRLPISNGVLDRALQEVIQSGGPMPDWVVRELHFRRGRAMFECMELQDVLAWMKRAELTSDLNFRYETAAVLLDRYGALDLLGDMNVGPETARAVGAALRASIARQREAALDRPSG